MATENFEIIDNNSGVCSVTSCGLLPPSKKRFYVVCLLGIIPLELASRKLLATSCERAFCYIPLALGSREHLLEKVE